MCTGLKVTFSHWRAGLEVPHSRKPLGPEQTRLVGQPALGPSLCWGLTSPLKVAPLLRFFMEKVEVSELGVQCSPHAVRMWSLFSGAQRTSREGLRDPRAQIPVGKTMFSASMQLSPWKGLLLNTCTRAHMHEHTSMSPCELFPRSIANTSACVHVTFQWPIHHIKRHTGGSMRDPESAV